VIDYTVARVEEALRKGHEKLNAELERMRQRKLQLEVQLVRLVNAIAWGQPSQSFMTAIGEPERELQAIANKLVEPFAKSSRSGKDGINTKKKALGRGATAQNVLCASSLPTPLPSR
jgi:hypothetical protein